MPTNDKETTDAQEGEEDKTSEENDENEEQDLEKKLKEYKAQKEHYKSKVEKLQSALEDSDDEDNDSSITRKSSDGDDWQERMELKVDGYSDDEIEFIMKNGGKDAVDDPHVQRAVESIREEKKANEASEEASDSGGGGEIVKGYTQEDLQDMSVEELEEILPKSN